MNTYNGINKPLLLFGDTRPYSPMAQLTPAYGPHVDMTSANTAIISEFTSMSNVPRGFTFCVIEGGVPKEYWFTAAGDWSSVEEKQKSAEIDLSNLQFQAVTDPVTDITTLQVSTDGGTTWTDVGTIPTSSSDLSQLKLRIYNNKFQVSYDNGVSWANVGGNNDGNIDAAGVFPMSVLSFRYQDGYIWFTRDDTGNYYRACYLGSIGGGNSSSDSSSSSLLAPVFYTIDKSNVNSVTAEGTTYTGQNAVNCLVVLGIDYVLDFQIWVEQNFPDAPEGSRIAFISTMSDKAHGPVIGNTDTYSGTTVAEKIVNGSTNLDVYYIYETEKLGPARWGALAWTGKYKGKGYYDTPVSMTPDYIPYYYEDGEMVPPDHAQQLTIKSAIPFEITNIPLVAGNHLLDLEINGVQKPVGTHFNPGVYVFDIDYHEDALTAASVDWWEGLISISSGDTVLANTEVYACLDVDSSDRQWQCSGFIAKSALTNQIIPNARIYMDGNLVSTTGNTHDSVGHVIARKPTATLLITADGYEDLEETINTQYSSDVTYEKYLQPIVENGAVLKFIVLPRGARAYLDGLRVIPLEGEYVNGNCNNVFNLIVPQGEHTLLVSKTGCMSKTLTFTVPPAGLDLGEISLDQISDYSYIYFSNLPIIPESGGIITVYVGVTERINGQNLGNAQILRDSIYAETNNFSIVSVDAVSASELPPSVSVLCDTKIVINVDSYNPNNVTEDYDPTAVVIGIKFRRVDGVINTYREWLHYTISDTDI